MKNSKITQMILITIPGIMLFGRKKETNKAGTISMLNK